MAVQHIGSQHFYGGIDGPLDATTLVASRSDLNDPTKVPPFVGKVVGVTGDGIFYICIAVDNTTFAATWKPFISMLGTALYLTAPTGKTYKITVDPADEHLVVSDADLH